MGTPEFSPAGVLARPESRLCVLLCASSVLGALLISGLWAGGNLRAGPLGPKTTVALEDILGVMVEAVEAAGREVVSVAATQQLGTKSKGTVTTGTGAVVDDPVTDADLRSNRVLMGRLAAAFPGLKVASEERGGAHTPGPEEILAATAARSRLRSKVAHTSVAAGRVTVWVDPLDATKEFVEGLVQYVTVMACVAVDGRPAAGVVHFPFLGRTVWGMSPQLAGAAAPSSTSFSVAPPPPTAGVKGRPLRFVVSRSHAGRVAESAAELGASEIVGAGGAGYKAVELLDGKADAYVHSTLIKKWDLCAGDALLRSQGGALTGLAGEPVDYSTPEQPVVSAGVAAALYGHNQLVERLTAAGFTPEQPEPKA